MLGLLEHSDQILNWSLRGELQLDGVQQSLSVLGLLDFVELGHEIEVGDSESGG